MPHAVLCWVKLGDHRVSEHVSLLPLPFPMLLQQHPLDRHSANRLIKIIIHAHARTDRTRRIHSIYSESDERLRRLYQYLQFWLCCSRAWAVKRSRLELYEPEMQSQRSIIGEGG